MTTLYARAYDITATGFYFETAEQFSKKSAALKNESGDMVEEFEIQFIDGEEIDGELAKAWSLNQINFAAFLDAVEEWTHGQKIYYIIAVGECGYPHDDVADRFDEVDIDIHEIDSLKDLAEEFVEEGLFGDIPERLQFYIDYDAIARDLEVEYSETTIAGERFVYRCG